MIVRDLGGSFCGSLYLATVWNFWCKPPQSEYIDLITKKLQHLASTNWRIERRQN